MICYVTGLSLVICYQLWYIAVYHSSLFPTSKTFKLLGQIKRHYHMLLLFLLCYFALFDSLPSSLPPSLPSASWVSIHSTLHVVCECCVNSFPQMRSGLFAMAIILQSCQSSRRLSSSATTIVHQPFTTTDHMFSQNVMVSHFILTKERVLTCSPCFKQIMLK